MSTIIRFKRRLTEGSEGIKLLPGEPFFNVKDKKFYVGDENGTPYDIVEIKNNNSGENSTISFTVGNHQYNKTINNVAHSTEAEKLTSTNIGNSETPVYFVDGVPTPCGYTIAASVPSTAKFTDTTYTYATNLEPGLIKLGKESDDKSTLQDHLPLLKSTEGEGYIDVTKINKSITWETF